jgi:hypothetical protein
MLDPKDTLSGFPAKEIARICDVDLTTARRWKRGAICPPQSALMMICGDLGFVDPAWRGWVLRRGHLISPEGWEISMHAVLATQLQQAQIAAYQSENRALKAQIAHMDMTSLDEQPTPDSWDVQILTG